MTPIKLFRTNVGLHSYCLDYGRKSKSIRLAVVHKKTYADDPYIPVTIQVAGSHSSFP